MITNEMIHPELRRRGRLIRALVPYFKRGTFRLGNAALAPFRGHQPQQMAYQQIFIDREGQSPSGQLRLCVYRPLVPKAESTGLLWLHGGGYAMGIPEQDEATIERFVSEFGCTVVAPDYTLSTSAPYPAALEDAYQGLLWLRDQTELYQLRADQLVVGGSSAGGGLTAALTTYARDKEEVAVAFQLPLYPMLDDRMETPSSQGNDAPAWNSKSNRLAWQQYLGPLAGGPAVPPYAAPARETNYAKLPPLVTYIGSLDPFLDETRNYVECLKQAGVPATLQVFEGCFHAFDVLVPNSTPARAARDFLDEQFRLALATYFAPQPDLE